MEQLAEILSSRTRAEIFRIFFNTSEGEFYFRDIQRRIKQSIGATKQELEKLVSLDLLIPRRSGNRVYYKANNKHPLFKPICELVQKTSGVRLLLKEALNDHNIDFAFIFGSYAKDEITSESDIDVFVIGNINSQELSSLLKSISRKINREINYFIISKDEFIDRKSQNDHFINSITNSPKIFVKGVEDDFNTMGKE